jgi:3-hydroxyisobutyrate dehydrogenase-like beta-hydroxyacid dehydrogenase
MVAVDDDEIAACEMILSIVPPGQALALANRLRPALARAPRRPLYADCNAVSPETVKTIAAVVQATGAAFVDAGIIGGPPKADGSAGPTIYASGDAARDFATLRDCGLDIRTLDGAPVGAASALKMSYAGITKGLTALASSMALAASRAGIADLLAAELAASQPALARWIVASVPGMYSKAYRWVAEMEEIAAFIGNDMPEADILRGAAGLYDRIASDEGGNAQETSQLSLFVEAAGTEIHARQVASESRSPPRQADPVPALDEHDGAASPPI